MKIYDFVSWELDKFRNKYNFAPDELCYFNLRAKHYSNFQIAMEMNISESKVSKLAKAVKTKIRRVL